MLLRDKESIAGGEMSGFEARAGAEWLSGLPSRGHLVNVERGFVKLRAPKPYLCDHDTTPPANQVISSNPSSLVFMELLNSKRRRAAQAASANNSRKEQETVDKRQYSHINQGNSCEDPASKRFRLSGTAGTSEGCTENSSSSIINYTVEQLRKRTVSEIRDVLRLRQLPLTGRKEELISRIIEHQRRAQRSR